MNVERLIRRWVYENFGESELLDPSWNIQELAEYIEENLQEDEDVLFI